jgi:hypothetical protein
MDEEYYENNDILEEKETKEPICPRCGLRTYSDECPNCGTPIIDKKDDEEEEYDWREHKR